MRQAFLIHRIAPRDALRDFIERATEVFCRQFVREMRLIEKLQELGLFRFTGAFPSAGLEKTLRKRLAGCGWSAAGLESQLRQLEANDPEESDDPAVNRFLMLRLEFLTDLLLVTTFDIAGSRWDDVIPAGYRQLVSGANSGAGEDGHGVGGRPMKWLGLTGPEPVIRHWRAAIRHRRHAGGGVPTWFCVLSLLREALSVWNEHDPDTIPTQVRILQRDGYLCQAPGCSSRRQLEVHHVVFRSRGGTNQGANLITLCHAHHAHMLHRGRIAVSGVAPNDLRWEMGLEKGQRPLWVLHGEKLMAD